MTRIQKLLQFNKVMKNNKLIIIVGVIILAVLVSGGYFVISSNKQSSNKQAQTPQIQDEAAEPISAKEIGLKLTIRDDKKAIKFSIENATDIESVDYQISYTKEVKGEEVPEGLIGEAKPEDGKIEIKYREFGTCSSGTCRYDTVVSPIKVTLKIVKTNGKVYQTEESIEI